MIVGFFVVTVLLMVVAIEAGYRLGFAVHRRSDEEKESSASAIAGATMGLLAFILAFTFAIVADRYDTRKALVREDAGSIRTAFLRSDFLPQDDREKAAGLLAEYVDWRLQAAQAAGLEQTRKAVAESEQVQRQLWAMAVKNARLDMNSDVAALYIESLNELINVHALRVTIGIETRLPDEIWLVLFALLVLTMLGFGYQMAIAGSGRSWAIPLLALSFSVVLTLIALLDSPESGYFRASQQPLLVLREELATAGENLRRSQTIPKGDN
ncbi:MULTISPECIES: bestrophin-like domain [Pseudomonas]|uniref:bestrophin-like domain n=1 Tax=Pseudomonas TaxID=286 RepID=UPI001553722D|nr:DUF4239 domain-containing protein [Pseudomonas tumuqii]